MWYRSFQNTGPSFGSRSIASSKLAYSYSFVYVRNEATSLSDSFFPKPLLTLRSAAQWRKQKLTLCKVHRPLICMRPFIDQKINQRSQSHAPKTHQHKLSYTISLRQWSLAEISQKIKGFNKPLEYNTLWLFFYLTRLQANIDRFWCTVTQKTQNHATIWHLRYNTKK